MAKARTFWLARDKGHDYYDGKVEEYSDILAYRKKPKALKDPWSFVSEEGVTTELVDIRFNRADAAFDMCPDYFKHLSGLDIPYGKAIKVQLVIV